MVTKTIFKKAAQLALKKKKKRDIVEKESIATAKKKKEGIKELKKQHSPKGLSSSPARETVAAQEALGKKSVTSQAQKGYRGEIKNIAVESKTPKAGVSSAGKKKIDNQVGKLKKQIKNAQRNPRLRRALAMDKRYGTVAKLQSKLKKLQKIQKKFTGPKDVKTFKGKELDKKLKELGIPKVSKVPPKPQKGPTRPINPEERSGRDYRIDVNRKREPEFFKDKDPYDPKQTSGPTNIEYAKKKKLKSGRRIGSIKIPKKTKKLKVDQEPNRKKQPIDPRDLAKNLIEAGELPKGLPRKQSFKKKSGGKLRGMGKALRGGGKVMRG